MTAARFTVRPRPGCFARPVDEASPEAAVAAYVEDFAHDADEDETLTLIVRDETTGREQCFRVDLATGATGVCG